MALKPETKAWLEHMSPALNENVRTILSEAFEKDEVQAKMFEAVVPRSEYSRSLNSKDEEVKKAKQEIETAKQTAESWKTANEEWRDKEQKKVNDALKQWEDSHNAVSAKAQAYEAHLQRLVQNGFITAEEAKVALSNSSVAAPPTNPNPAQPARKVITEDDLDNRFSRNNVDYLAAIARINDLADEYNDLFGKRLNRQELVQSVLEAKGAKTIDQVFEEKYGVSGKREEIRKAQWEADTQKRIEEALVKDRSERAISGEGVPASTPEGDTHIMTLFKSGSGRSMGVSDSVAKASEAWRQGRLGEARGKST